MVRARRPGKEKAGRFKKNRWELAGEVRRIVAERRNRA
jgi:hypothetical protein